MAKVLPAQNDKQNYYDLLRQADSVFRSKDYSNATKLFSKAFEANGWKSDQISLYNAACAWTQIKVPDSAFFNLMKIATMLNYDNQIELENDKDFFSLHSDARWTKLCSIVHGNYIHKISKYLNPETQTLDSIYYFDQKSRYQLQDTSLTSIQYQNLWKLINLQDSVNLIKTTQILDKYGWLGPDSVGEDGVRALLLVIQHSTPKVQKSIYRS